MDLLTQHKQNLKDFISIVDVIRYLSVAYPEASHKDLASILLKKFREMGDGVPSFGYRDRCGVLRFDVNSFYAFGINHVIPRYDIFLSGIIDNKVRISYDKVYSEEILIYRKDMGSMSWDDIGFSRDEIDFFLKSLGQDIDLYSDIENEKFLTDVERKIVLTAYLAKKIKSGDSKPTPVSHNSPAEWEGFSGKDTALMLIAGMAVALEKSGGKYLHGEKLNKSAVAQAATNAINEYGAGTTISLKALTNLITSALEVHAPKLEGE